MCFQSNQHLLSMKHPFISLYSQYQTFISICLLNMNSPVFPSLDDIYCRCVIKTDLRKAQHQAPHFFLTFRVDSQTKSWKKVQSKYM